MKDDLLLWHSCLGHGSSSQLSKLCLSLTVQARDEIHNFIIYPLAKETRLSFKDIDFHAWAHFDIVHLDVWEPYEFQQ